MKQKFKAGFFPAAIFAVILMTSCSKENIVPGGILGDPKDPGNGIVSTTSYSPDLGTIPPQRQESTDKTVDLTFNHGVKISSRTIRETKAK